MGVDMSSLGHRGHNDKHQDKVKPGIEASRECRFHFVGRRAPFLDDSKNRFIHLEPVRFQGVNEVTTISIAAKGCLLFARPATFLQEPLAPEPESNACM